MARRLPDQCASAVTLGGEEKRCVYREKHDGMHRAYTLWSDCGYIEWASGYDLSYDVPLNPLRHLKAVPDD